ncbi:YlxQ-related RNA-binding protein [Limosilactobacillus mucosae]|uniref:YlxQ-related RNA-binding protein n=1 Tax=Limosilactobacillus mucosae TaxID=97478 RepID=UPI003991DFAE
MTTSKQQLLNMLGLARRAGQITTGEGLVLKSIRAHQARVVFMACDAGHSTVKQFINKCQYYQIPLITMFTKAELSRAIGQKRTVIAVEQAGFAKRIIELANDAEETTN